MARYVSPETRRRKKKEQQIRKMAMYASMVVFVLLVSFVIVKVINGFSKKEKPEEVLINPVTENTTPEETPTSATNGVFFGPEVRVLDASVIKPDINVIRTAENGRVSMSYFSDAIFMGDSLADGFNEYSGTLGLYEIGTRFLTARSLSPRSFTQPGVTINFGTGPMDPWAVISQESPGKVYVTIGTNALNAGQDPQEIIDSYYEMIDLIRKNAPDAVIYVTTITPTTKSIQSKMPNISNERINATNELIVKMCNEKGLALLNIHDLFVDSEGCLSDSIAYSDGIHLKPSGYKAWLDYMISHTVYRPDSPYIPGSPYML